MCSRLGDTNSGRISHHTTPVPQLIPPCLHDVQRLHHTVWVRNTGRAQGAIRSTDRETCHGLRICADLLVRKVSYVWFGRNSMEWELLHGESLWIRNPGSNAYEVQRHREGLPGTIQATTTASTSRHHHDRPCVTLTRRMGRRTSLMKNISDVSLPCGVHAVWQFRILIGLKKG